MEKQGDCLEKMKDIPDGSVDAIITDPPYGLSFMGKHWDKGVPGVHFWQEMIRVLKPGGYLLSFSGTRTYHRMATAIEDGGFEIRDMIEWVYGSGFPKSLNIGKAVDKLNDRFYDKGFQDYCNERRTIKGYTHSDVNRLMGTALTGGGFSSSIMGDKEFNELPTVEMYNKLKPILEMDNRYDELVERIEREREVVGKDTKARSTSGNSALPTVGGETVYKSWDLTKGTSEWEGWGTALKPAHEPICMARKPLAEKTVAENVLKYGTGGINIDESRVGTTTVSNGGKPNTENNRIGAIKGYTKGTEKQEHNYGRFPANLIHDGSDEVRECFPETKTGSLKPYNQKNKGTWQGGRFEDGKLRDVTHEGDSGNASRFFKSIIYQAKASKRDRGEGNIHPTVKSVALMEYLINMVTKEGGNVLDPFMGSGTTGVACKNLNRNFIGIELDPDYFKIAEKRINESIESNGI